jgi:hypothetical protein
VRLIEQRHRAGFGANHNTVIRATTGRYVFILNEDTTIGRLGLRAEWSHTSTRTRRVARFGPRLVYPDGRVQSSAWRFPEPRDRALGLLTLGPPRPPVWRRARTRDVDWAMAAALLVRREALERGRGSSTKGSSSTPRRRISAAGCGTPAGGRSSSQRSRRPPRVAVQRRHPGATDQRDVAGPAPLLAEAPLCDGRSWRGAAHGARYAVRGLIRARDRDFAARMRLHARDAIRVTGPGLRELAEDWNRTLRNTR